jgi:hypothetical protein
VAYTSNDVIQSTGVLRGGFFFQLEKNNLKQFSFSDGGDKTKHGAPEARPDKQVQ